MAPPRRHATPVALDPNVLYRVRDKDWAALHGENLSMSDALRLKEHVVGARKSTTARLEPMSVPPPEWYAAAIPDDVALHGDADAQDPELEAMRAPALRAAAAAAADAQVRADRAKTVRVVDAPPVPVRVPERPARFAFQTPKKKAQQPPPPRAPYRDRTAAAEVYKRTTPPPPDRTAADEIYRRASPVPSHDPEPYMSPLAAAELPDDPPPAAPNGHSINDDDLVDVIADLGGVASDDDVKRAQEQADAERNGTPAT